MQCNAMRVQIIGKPEYVSESLQLQFNPTLDTVIPLAQGWGQTSYFSGYFNCIDHLATPVSLTSFLDACVQ